MPAITASVRRLAPARTPAPVADKREAILRPPRRCSPRNGFFQSQVADVARAAGVAAGTVYLYFRSKDDLLVSLFERTMREAIAEGRAALEGIDDPRERADAHRAAASRTARPRPRSRRGLPGRAAAVDEVHGAVLVHLPARLPRPDPRNDRRGPADARRSARDVNPTIAAKVFFGALDEMATNWILSRRRYSLVAEADAVVDLFVGGVGSQPTVRHDKRSIRA